MRGAIESAAPHWGASACKFFAGILNILWESARTRPPLAASMPPGRRETRSFSEAPRLFSLFFALLASLGGVFGALGLYLGPLALDSTIFINFLAFRDRFLSIFEPSRGAPTLDFARPYGTLATFLHFHLSAVGSPLGSVFDPKNPSQNHLKIVKKSIKKRSRKAQIRSKAPFWAIFESRPGSENGSKPPKKGKWKKQFLNFFCTFW